MILVKKTTANTWNERTVGAPERIWRNPARLP